MFFFHKKTLFDNPTRFIIAAGIIGILGGLVAGSFEQPYVEISRSFIVRNARQVATSVYDYEGYYTLQTANEGAKALVAWLTSPGGVTAVYGRAGVRAPFETFRDYERAFSVRRDDTPFFEVRGRSSSYDDAGQLAQSLEVLLGAELRGYQQSASLTLGSTPTVLLYHPIPWVRNIMYGTLLGVALGSFVILFKKAMIA